MSFLLPLATDNNKQKGIISAVFEFSITINKSTNPQTYYVNTTKEKCKGNRRAVKREICPSLGFREGFQGSDLM